MPTTDHTLSNGRPDRLFVADQDPAYQYRWMNKRDQNMYDAQWEGWEAAPVDPKTLPPGVAPPGQDTNNPGGGTTYSRGDLILMRMPKERYEQNVRRPAEEARKRQQTIIDTMVDNANENARRTAHDRGLKRIPDRLVFREDVGDPT